MICFQRTCSVVSSCTSCEPDSLCWRALYARHNVKMFNEIVATSLSLCVTHHLTFSPKHSRRKVTLAMTWQPAASPAATNEQQSARPRLSYYDSSLSPRHAINAPHCASSFCRHPRSTVYHGSTTLPPLLRLLVTVAPRAFSACPRNVFGRSSQPLSVKVCS